ncbi:hypothetical protein M8C21_017241 [Ambrosia artemisiifolia]|uniref:Core Histone H2A/H2B/H3 domain-containing protein n=1 Tax=Ambrosia artemisiifolia TaxID=4212 RepID=A0AAD5CT41_AMBAR|nr:hypothetical protein M8C21_017241 [Ambrosia artemisiifolia]
MEESMRVGGGQQTEPGTSTTLPAACPTPSAPQPIPPADPDVMQQPATGQRSTHEPMIKPTVVAEPLQKEARAAAKGDKNKKRSKQDKTFAVYIYKVLKHVHPDIGISSSAMAVINSFMNDMLQKLAQESSWLAEYNKRPTITCREIEAAVRLVLPSELAKHAVLEGTKAVTKYACS